MSTFYIFYKIYKNNLKLNNNYKNVLKRTFQ